MAKLERQIENVTFERFLADLYIADAVAMQLVVVGESANRLSVAFKDAHPQISWPRIISLRHLIAHEYEKLDPARLWDVVINHGPRLAADISDAS